MLSEALAQLFKRDFERLGQEIEQYSTEEKLWIKAEGINNSAGNLSYHITGNLQHYIGAVLGGTNYQRDRDFEFNGRVSQDELLSEIAAAKKAIIETLEEIPDEDLENPYPVEVFGDEMTTEYFLSHLYGHLNYHLGQINYHRRLLS